jgi:hypothetical protein
LTRWLAIVLLLCTALFASRVQAGSTVLIIVPEGDGNDYHSFQSRLQAELIAEGFAVATAGVATTPDPTTIADSADRWSTPIAISISLSHNAVFGSVWVADLKKGGGTLRPVPAYPLSAQSSEIFAVKATDVLQGLLLELGYRKPAIEPPVAVEPSSPRSHAKPPPNVSTPSPTEPATAQVKSSAVSKETRTYYASTGLVLMEQPHSYPLSVGGRVSIVRRLGRWRLGIEGLLFVPTTVTSDIRSATLDQFQIGAVVQGYQPLTRELSLYGTVSGGIYAIYLTGTAVGSDKSAREDYAVIGYNSAGLGLEWAPEASISVNFGASLVAPWQDVDAKIEASGVPFARVAAPLFLQHLGVQIAW